MKAYYHYLLGICLILLLGCQPQPQTQTPTLSEADKETIQREVKERFHQLISTLNQLNAGAWAEFFSRDEFISAILATDYYGARKEWVEAVTQFFSLRERQQVEPLAVRVTALAPGLALMTSEEKGSMGLKDGTKAVVKHVFTMLWKKEADGWKVLHSHEAWKEEPPA